MGAVAVVRRGNHLHFPSPDELRPFKSGSKVTFIPSLMDSTADFIEIPFPNGKGQMRERQIFLPLELWAYCLSPRFSAGRAAYQRDASA